MSKERFYSDEFNIGQIAQDIEDFDPDYLPDIDLNEFNSSNNLDIYMRQAVSVALPRLTYEQEFMVGSKIQNGLKNFEKASNELEKQKITQETKEATNILVSKHLLFVIPHAKKYSNLGVEFLDLIDQGNLILFKAAEKFDPTKGQRFSTYSHFWLKDKLLRYVYNFGRIIRLPVYLQENIFKMNNIEHKLFIRLGRRPTIDELSQQTGFSIKKLEGLKIARKNVISLEEPINKFDDLESEFGNTIMDQKSLDSFENKNTKIDSDIIFKKLEKLVENGVISKRNMEIFCYRYGRNNGIYSSLDETGMFFGVTRERIRQIEKDIIAKIKL